jgi:hypothetical protein
VVLFPALANVLLSRASQSEPRCRARLRRRPVHGAAQGQPAGALPSVFAAARVSVPGAVTGALLAEWLSTGTGIGGSILKFNAQAQFAQLWTSIALITLITLCNLVQIVENIVLARMGMAAEAAPRALLRRTGTARPAGRHAVGGGADAACRTASLALGRAGSNAKAGQCGWPRSG